MKIEKEVFELKKAIRNEVDCVNNRDSLILIYLYSKQIKEEQKERERD